MPPNSDHCSTRRRKWRTATAAIFACTVVAGCHNGYIQPSVSRAAFVTEPFGNGFVTGSVKGALTMRADSVYATLTNVDLHERGAGDTPVVSRTPQLSALDLRVSIATRVAGENWNFLTTTPWVDVLAYVNRASLNDNVIVLQAKSPLGGIRSDYTLIITFRTKYGTDPVTTSAFARIVFTP